MFSLFSTGYVTAKDTDLLWQTTSMILFFHSKRQLVI